MTIEEFRILHSTVIEHYQYIEHHLEGIYAALCGKPFIMGLEDVEKSSIVQLIRKIKNIEEERQICVLTDSDFERLQHICTRRNFWSHNCYVDMVFDRRTDAPKKDIDIKSLIEDINEARMIRDILFEKKQIYM